MEFDVMLAMECCVSGFDRCEECPVPQKDKDDCTCGTYVMERAIEKIRELTSGRAHAEVVGKRFDYR